MKRPRSALSLAIAILAMLFTYFFGDLPGEAPSERAAPSDGSPRGERFQARVTRISDGDSFWIERRGAAERVRMAEIDAPERDQPHGRQARKALTDMIGQREVSIEVFDRDRYGRTVGRIRVGDTDVNAEMVRRGHAWAYRRHLRRPELSDFEAAARRAQIGLWRLPESQRVPPWDWRKAHPRR